MASSFFKWRWTSLNCSNTSFSAMFQYLQVVFRFKGVWKLKSDTNYLQILCSYSQNMSFPAFWLVLRTYTISSHYVLYQIWHSAESTKNSQSFGSKLESLCTTGMIYTVLLTFTALLLTGYHLWLWLGYHNYFRDAWLLHCWILRSPSGLIK